MMVGGGHCGRQWLTVAAWRVSVRETETRVLVTTSRVRNNVEGHGQLQTMMSTGLSSWDADEIDRKRDDLHRIVRMI